MIYPLRFNVSFAQRAGFQRFAVEFGIVDIGFTTASADMVFHTVGCLAHFSQSCCSLIMFECAQFAKPVATPANSSSLTEEKALNRSLFIAAVLGAAHQKFIDVL